MILGLILDGKSEIAAHAKKISVIIYLIKSRTVTNRIFLQKSLFSFMRAQPYNINNAMGEKNDYIFGKNCFPLYQF